MTEPGPVTTGIIPDPTLDFGPPPLSLATLRVSAGVQDAERPF